MARPAGGGTGAEAGRSRSAWRAPLAAAHDHLAAITCLVGKVPKVGGNQREWPRRTGKLLFRKCPQLPVLALPGGKVVGCAEWTELYREGGWDGGRGLDHPCCRVGRVLRRGTSMAEAEIAEQIESSTTENRQHQTVLRRPALPFLSEDSPLYAARSPTCEAYASRCDRPAGPAGKDGAPAPLAAVPA
jgi:hypothetical protein